MWLSGICLSPQPSPAPHALKYRKATTLHPYAAAYVLRIFSKINLLSPYEFTGSLGWSSGMGTTRGVPYTAALEENTNFQIPCLRSVSNSEIPPATLTSKNGPGLMTDSGTEA